MSTNCFSLFFSARSFAPFVCAPMPLTFGFCRVPMVTPSLFMSRLPFCPDTASCSWMDFPVMRDTRMDYLLNPELALRTNTTNSGYVQPFGQFPQIPGLTLTPSQTSSTPKKDETPEEKAEREAKEAKEQEERDAKAERDAVANEKTDIYKDIFKNIASVINTDSPEYKKLERAYKKALEEKDAEKRYEAMKKVFGDINNPEVLRRAILQNSNVIKMLVKSGYNVDQDKNPLLNPSGDGKVVLDVESLHDEMTRKDGSNDYLARATAILDSKGDKNLVLQFLSLWNRSFSDGFVQTIGKCMPNTPQEQTVWKEACQTVKEALKNEAETLKQKQAGEYPELDALTKELDKKFRTLNESKLMTQPMVNAFANACDAMYAYLRLQEAKLIDRTITSQFGNEINSVLPDTISETMIYDETVAALEKENIKTPEKLDELQEGISLTNKKDEEVTKKDDNKDKTKQVEKTIKEAIDEDLIERYPITDNDDIYIYKSKEKDSSENYRYYIQKDDKFYEIKDCAGITQTKDEDGNIKVTLTIKGGEPVKLEELKAEQLQAFDKDNVPSKAREEAKRQEEERKALQAKIDAVETFTPSGEFADKGYEALSINSVLNEIARRIAGNEEGNHDADGTFEKLSMEGFFHDKTNNLYYKYDENSNCLKYLEGVTNITPGAMEKTNKDGNVETEPCVEYTAKDGGITEYAQEFAKNLKTYNDISKVKTKLAKFYNLTDVNEIVEFITEFNRSKGWFEVYPTSSNFCTKISSVHYKFKKMKDSEKKEFLSKTAKQLMLVIETTGFNKNSQEYKDLETVASGQLIAEKQVLLTENGPIFNERKDINSTARRMDEIIVLVLKAYNEIYENSEGED